MKVAVTGGTGFIGTYLLHKLLDQGHEINAWFRDTKPGQLSHPKLKWVNGDLEAPQSINELIAGVDSVIHSALWRQGDSFRSGSGDVVRFAEVNVIGSLRLMEAAYQAKLDRFVFVSTCAVHEKILEDRQLDEMHPLWPMTHYGAHKAAIEKFVHSYGFGMKFPVCALRPSGVYGLHHQPQLSKWFQLVQDIVHGKDVEVSGGGKEVHAQDVAQACSILLTAKAADVSGEAFSCCDDFVSNFEVAKIARRLAKSNSKIVGQSKTPKHQIETGKIESLGMKFGGESLLESTIRQLVDFIQANG